MRINVGIIIYKSDMALLLKNLTMLSRQSSSVDAGLELKIILLDNDEGRQLSQIRTAVENNLPHAFAERVHYMSSENIGFGAGHNKIFNFVSQEGDFDYYLCANPDGIPHKEMLGELVSFAIKNNDRGIFEARQFPVEFSKAYDPVTGRTDWCSGCCLMFPKAVFERLGGFDDFFFMYMEDVDISWRAKLLGYGCYMVHNALFFHFVDENERDMTIMREWAAISAYKLGWKYNNPKFRRKCLKKLHKFLSDKEIAGIDDSSKKRIAGLKMFDANTFMNFENGFYFSMNRW